MNILLIRKKKCVSAKSWSKITSQFNKNTQNWSSKAKEWPTAPLWKAYKIRLKRSKILTKISLKMQICVRKI